MRVLIDVHHSDLMESLHRLFADRLGFEVIVPFGLGWRDAGYWNFGHGYPDGGLGVARQFLLMPEYDDLQPQRSRRMTTLDEAREMDFDLVVASVPDNYPGYARFAAEKGARFAIQVGNVNQYVDHSLSPLILDATGQYPGGVPFTPEFDIGGAFAYASLAQLRNHGHPYFDVATYVNLFPGLPCYSLFEETFTHLSEEWFGRWVYGHRGDDGFIKPTSDIGRLMREAAFGWHDKVTGDGFGYVIHYWASVGRPLIGHASHYRNQVAADLWEDGVTAIDLDQHSPADAARLMEEIGSDPDRHAEMCFTIAQRVRERIDFEADAERVADALGLATWTAHFNGGGKRLYVGAPA
jgi:glycosyltransferase involved in cell wall biosynthesis